MATVPQPILDAKANIETQINVEANKIVVATNIKQGLDSALIEVNAAIAAIEAQP